MRFLRFAVRVVHLGAGAVSLKNTSSGIWKWPRAPGKCNPTFVSIGGVAKIFRGWVKSVLGLLSEGQGTHETLMPALLH